MTSKERVRAVLNHKIPDMVPWGEWAIDFDTVERIIGHKTYYRAKARSIIAFWEGRRDEVVQSWKEDGILFFNKMNNFDIINIAAMASSVAPPKDYEYETPKKIDDTTWEFSDGTVYKYSEITADLTKMYDPHVGEKEYKPEDFEVEAKVEPPDESCFEVVDAFIKEFGQDRFLMGPSGDEIGIFLLGGNFEEGGGGFTYGLMQFLDNPETVKAAIKMEIKKANILDKYYIRKNQDAVAWGQDFSGTEGPFVSPEMFREFALPAIKERVKNIHEKHKLPVMKHVCGNNNKLLDMFVEAGYDSYMSIQPTAHMDLSKVKERYGKYFVPWGGVPVELLVSGTKEEVRKATKYALYTYKKGGRYIFGSSHSIAVWTKYDNFMVMLEEFMKNREY